MPSRLFSHLHLLVAAQAGLEFVCVFGHDGVGRAANYAAKLTTLPASYSTRLTTAVFNRLNGSAKTTNGQSMWEKAKWTAMGGIHIYRSTWGWRLS